MKGAVGIAKKAATSNTGKRLMNSLKRQAIESGTQVLGDVIEGKKIGDSLNNQLSSVRATAGKALKNLGNNKRKKAPKKIVEAPPPKKRKKNRRFKSNIKQNAIF
jgi:hypothetical protein